MEGHLIIAWEVKHIMYRFFSWKLKIVKGGHLTRRVAFCLAKYGIYLLSWHAEVENNLKESHKIFMDNKYIFEA